jgi:hypothetical protein
MMKVLFIAILLLAFTVRLRADGISISFTRCPFEMFLSVLFPKLFSPRVELFQSTIVQASNAAPTSLGEPQ